LCRSRQGRFAPQWGVPLDKLQVAQLKNFGGNVRRERMALKLTQERLAERVDLNLRTVQKIEGGKVNILITTVLRFKKALQCPWDDLLPK
jgi:transcriptional regulator with XRE-family HTH domain